MSKSTNPFKDLTIDRGSIPEVCKALGCSQYSYERAGNSFQLGFVLDGVAFKMAVFENRNGSTTLSSFAGQDLAVFNRVAGVIASTSNSGMGGAFELSVPRFPSNHVDNLFAYLIDANVETVSDVVHPHYRIAKFKGIQGDVLTTKIYENGTLQLQGKRAMVATLVLDYLSNVLEYAEAIKAQLNTFSVTLDVKKVIDEFEGRFPAAHRRISDVVKAQLVTAMALSKVDIELPDYSPIAFPALRGLEGFIKTELENAGLNPGAMKDFGEYFEKDIHKYKMRELPHQHVGEQISVPLAGCYTMFNAQRHGIAHMGTTQAETRILPALADAQQIVTKVLTTIEEFCRILAKS